MATKAAQPGPSTARSRAGPSNAPIKTVAKRPTAKSGPASKTADKPEELAKDLDRVLKISRPANHAPVKGVSTATRTTNPVNRIASSSNVAKPRPTSRVPAPKPSGTVDKGKKRLEVAQTRKDDPPWVSPSLGSADRARGAMTAINDGMKALSGAVQEAQKGPEGNSSPSEKVKKEIRTSEFALKVLRELEVAGELTGKAADIEKVGQGLISRLLAFKMYDQVWAQLDIARTVILHHLPCSPKNSPSTEHNPTDQRSKLLALPDVDDNMEDPWRLILFQSLIHAWTALLGDGADLETLPHLLPFPESQGRHHPFQLALSIPTSASYATLILLHRQQVAITTSKVRIWLHTRCLALYTLTLLASTGTNSKVTPNQVWDHAFKFSSTICEQAKSNPALLAELADRICKLVVWVEAVTTARGERLDEWMGSSNWTRFTDLWMTLASKVGDVGMIDRVLALQTTQTPLSSEAPTSNVPSRTPSSHGSTKTIGSKQAVGNAEADTAAGIAALAKLDVLVKAYIDSGADLDGAAVESALRSTNLRELGDSLQCLPAAERSTRLLERTCRAAERARRGTLRLVPTSTGTAKETSLHLAARRWLIEAVDLVEDILSGTLDVSSAGRDLTSGAVTSLTYLCSNPGPSSQPSLALLERAHRLCDLVKVCSTVSERANLLHCVTATAQTIAGQYWRKDKYNEALAFGTASCSGAKEAIDLYVASDKDGNLDGEDTKAMGSLRNSLLKRYELVGACHVKLSDRKAAAETFCQALVSAPPKVVAQIQERAKSEPIRQVFASAEEVSSILQRLAALLSHDPECIDDIGPFIFGQIYSVGQGEEYAAAIGEQLLYLLDERGGPSGAEQIGEIMFKLGTATLGLYREDRHPIRRLRVALRLLSLIGQTGTHSEMFDQLAAFADRIPKPKINDEDAALAPYLPGLLATSTLLRALHSYQSVSEPTLTVLALAKQAMSELRALVLPPAVPSPRKAIAKRPLGRATTVKASPVAPPAAKSRAASETKITKTRVTITTPIASGGSPRKSRPSFTPMIIDDVSTFARLLGSMCSLLGILGLTLQKVESLKLLRALLRGRAEVADDYVLSSAELGTEYLLLGKITRATTVFAQAQRYADEYTVSLHTQCEIGLRYSAFLASTRNLEEAVQAYDSAGLKGKEIEMPKRASRLELHIDKIQSLERVALARYAAAAMASARDDITGTILHLAAAFRLRSRVGEVACRLATARPADDVEGVSESTADDPFTVSDSAKAIPPEQQPPKDEEIKTTSTSEHFDAKVLNGLQWRAAEMLFKTTLDWTAALSQRGSVWDAQGLLATAALLADSVKSSVFASRVATRQAELLFRRGKFNEAEAKLGEAIEGCPVVDGPDGVDIKRIRGDILAKLEMVKEAGQIFGDVSKEVHGLDTVFTTAEALLPSPRKLRLSSSTASKALTCSAIKNKEPLLPVALAHVLRRQAWLLRESGDIRTSDQLLAQLDALCNIAEIKADKHHLDGQIGLLDAFSHFKTDLWMSSLTESTIAMPMGSSKGRMRDRQSTRDSIQVILEKSQTAYLSALALSAGSGKVEEVRSACLSLALLRAFQTSLGQGSETVTAAAAEILATTPAITLHRELLENIEYKLQSDLYDLKWPAVSAIELSAPTRKTHGSSPSRSKDAHCVPLLTITEKSDTEQPYLDYWSSVRDRYASEGFFKVDQSQVDTLPPEWVVVSINVTDDKNTMFISRHQRDHPPLVFSLPLDRQGKRDGEAEEDLFTFEAAREGMRRIIEESNEGARNAKNIQGAEGRSAWWEKRYELDKQLKELVGNIEFCWLGAFKTILAPRPNLPPAALEAFREKLDRIFHSAIAGSTRTSGARPKVQLDIPLLECFAALSSKCKDEEAEDLVYFILDIYQFHGVPVALAELDMDQIGIDLRSALAELESSRPSTPLPTENLFLALDKNVSAFPWESIPILRGRSVSRVPSLPFLLHQWSLRDFVSPAPRPDNITLGSSSANEMPRLQLDSTKVFYILNPSGDLSRTQTHFEPWLTTMSTKAGWKGIKGRAPTEMELESALKEYDLVLYFGHGGAEQYIRSHKLCHLTRCATTMLWGCSSGSLIDQGDFDVRGTAWNYMTAGCPSLVATLWDVTDKDIDRLSESVFNKLHLDPTHVRAQSKKPQMEPLLPLSEISIVEAVARSRDECKLIYLTGAAPVVYGTPVWLK